MKDWRDPKMTVSRRRKTSYGTIVEVEVDPEVECLFREHRMNLPGVPNWRDDPTYDLKRKPQK